ncbi:hypothetical protein U9M48_007938 [Paspalum notatum var. saurae]|uniref:Uncharacterized protein n=1 Tax=Paspalum notatum var. saurae TaxID=547442 RepID=A0AAQ3SN64_PASNO
MRIASSPARVENTSSPIPSGSHVRLRFWRYAPVLYSCGVPPEARRPTLTQCRAEAKERGEQPAPPPPPTGP